MNEKMTLSGSPIEQVNDFTYLGSNVKSTDTDIKRRKALAWSAFHKMSNIWQSKTTPLKLKVNIFEVSCITVLLYGAETWIVTPVQMRSLDSFATSCYRIMLGISKRDHVTNATVYGKVNQLPISNTIKERQLR